MAPEGRGVRRRPREAENGQGRLREGTPGCIPIKGDVCATEGADCP